MLLVLRLDIEGALPEPGRWGDEWNAPLMTMFRRGLVTCTAVGSDYIRAPNRCGAVLCLCMLLAAIRADVGVQSAARG